MRRGNPLWVTKYVTAQDVRYFIQEQGERAQFTGVNEYFQRGDWTK
jgi:hypothetical protein